MGKGPKKHLKRLVAPKSWLLAKLGGTWAPRPSTGPHKLRECLPLTIALRNKLKYALTRREVIMIVMRRLIEVDGKVRTDINYPAGFMDVVKITKTNEQYRLLYDVKGRWVLHTIKDDEVNFKLCRVQKLSKAKKSSIGHNPFHTGQAKVVPYIVTHDGRTIRYPSPDVAPNDTVKLDLKTGKVVGHIKFEPGNMAMITKGANIGRVGIIVSKERHTGSFDIIHLRDKREHNFATRLSNVFVIGDGNKSWVTLPKQKGVKLTIMEEKIERSQQKHEKSVKKAKKATKEKK